MIAWATSQARRWWPDGSIALALVLLPFLFFWRILTPYAPDATTFPLGDFTELHYPYRAFVAAELAEGRLPFWNPFMLAGHPVLGDIQFGLFYPIALLFALLVRPFTVLALEFQVIIHVSLAALFTYLFVRQEIGSRIGGVVAALTFAFGGYLTSFPIQQMIILETAVWLPLALLFTSLAVARREVGFVLISGLVLGIGALVGHPQTFVYVLIGVLAYAIVRIWFARPNNRAMWAWPLLLPAVAVGGAAIQLFPSLGHLGLTSRTEVSYAFTSGGFAPYELLGLVLPSQLGGRPLYLGVLPLVLVVIAVMLGWKQGPIRFWLALGIVSLLFSLGGSTFLYSPLYLLPLGDLFRNQERLALLVSFSGAILAGHGIALLMRGLSQSSAQQALRALAAVAAIAAVALVVFLAGYAIASEPTKGLASELVRRSAFLLLLLLLTWALLALWLARQASPSLFAVLASLLIAFDLFTVNWQNNSVPGRPQDLLAPTATANFLRQQDGDLFRIASEGLLPGDGNAGSLFRLQDMVGNSPLTLRAFQKFEEQVEEWQRWRLLNVRFVITKRRLNDGRFRPVLQEGTINTYELEPALRTPRAYIAYQALTAASEAEALTLTKTVDVPRQVVLQGLLPLPLSGNPQPSTARIIEYQPNHVIIEANTNENGILVLSDTLTPGWRAWVDDQEMQIIPTNYLLRGVPVSQGSHRVELAYEPPGLRLGLWVSLLTLLGCALYLIWRWRRT